MRETIKEEIKDGGKVKRGFKCRKNAGRGMRMRIKMMRISR